MQSLWISVIKRPKKKMTFTALTSFIESTGTRGISLSIGRLLSAFTTLVSIGLFTGCERPAPEPSVPPTEATFQAAMPIPILGGDVNVTAVIEESVPGLNLDYFELRIAVTEGSNKHEVTSDVLGPENVDALVRHLKSTIGWKGPYLFIRSECGGGNTALCYQDHVFKKLDGKLIKLGVIAVWEGMPGDETTIGPGFQQGRFLDIWNDLAISELTSHAESPRFILSLVDQGDRLTMNPQLTWKLNAKTYMENEKLLAKLAQRPQLLTLDSGDLAPPLLFNAALAKLVGQHKAYQDTLRLAKRMIGQREVDRLEAVVGRAVAAEGQQQTHETTR